MKTKAKKKSNLFSGMTTRFFFFRNYIKKGDMRRTYLEQIQFFDII